MTFLKTFKIPVILLFLIIVFLASCEEEVKIIRDYPVLKTLEADSISTEGALFHATVITGDLNSILEYGFAWGSSLAIDSINSETLPVLETLNTVNFSVKMTHLLEKNHKYFVRSYIRTADLLVYGNLVTFSVPLNR